MLAALLTSDWVGVVKKPFFFSDTKGHDCVFYELLLPREKFPRLFFPSPGEPNSIYVEVPNSSGSPLTMARWSFIDTPSHRRWLETWLAEKVLEPRVSEYLSKIEDDLKSHLIDERDHPDTKYIETTITSMSGLRAAARDVSRSFLTWLDDNRDLKLTAEWRDSVAIRGAGRASGGLSLSDSIDRLDSSWRAVQLLTRLSIGDCKYSPGGMDMGRLLSKLGAGEDLKTRLGLAGAKRNSRYHSWSEFKRDGLLQITGEGLEADVLALRAMVGSWGQWPLDDVQLWVFERDGAKENPSVGRWGTVVVASRRAAVYLIRSAVGQMERGALSDRQRDAIVKALVGEDWWYGSCSADGNVRLSLKPVANLVDVVGGVDLGVAKGLDARELGVEGLLKLREHHVEVTDGCKSEIDPGLREAEGWIPDRIRDGMSSVAIVDGTEVEKWRLLRGLSWGSEVVPLFWTYRGRESSALRFVMWESEEQWRREMVVDNDFGRGEGVVGGGKLLGERGSRQSSPYISWNAFSELEELVSAEVSKWLRAESCHVGVGEFEEGLQLIADAGP